MFIYIFTKLISKLLYQLNYLKLFVVSPFLMLMDFFTYIFVKNINNIKKK